MNSNFEEFQKSISKELLIIKDRVRNLIGDANWAEEGRYKESVLKNIISRFLPSNLSLGSGFILTKEGENIKRSTQIDIIVYDNSYPLLFNEGDFIITTPENVRAIIEVKTAVKSQDIKDIIEKATNNAKLAPMSMFNGIFTFEKRGIEIKSNNLNSRLEQALLESKGAVNHISMGEDIFIKYWGRDEKYFQSQELYSFYDLKELSFSYFISNLIECIAPEKVLDKSWFLYPLMKPNGKEDTLLCNLDLLRNYNPLR